MTAPLAILRFQGLTSEQGDLGRAAEDVLAERVDDERAGAELGWFGIGIPEGRGGSGGTLADLAVVLEAAGSTASASAVTFTAGVVGQLLSSAAEPPVELLERLARGELTVGFPTADPPDVARGLAAGPELSGSVRALGADVDVLAVPIITDEAARLALVPTGHPGVSGAPVPPLDPSRPLVTWRLDGVPLTAAVVVTVDDLAARWRVLLALACALDAVGAARTALARTVAYAKIREQFGRPIGSFQAYKHRCATALMELKLGQTLAFRAADDLARSDDPTSALSAGVAATRSAVLVCGEAVQLHGGVGFTWEAGLHRYLKRARTAQTLADRPAALRQLLAATTR